jgi:hypothetical protein
MSAGRDRQTDQILFFNSAKLDEQSTLDWLYGNLLCWEFDLFTISIGSTPPKTALPWTTVHPNALTNGMMCVSTHSSRAL